MRNLLNGFMNPLLSLAAGTRAAFFSVLALGLCATVATAQKTIVLTGAPVQLGALTSGGWDGSQEPIGGTFVIGANGDVLVGDGYTSNFLQITPSGTDTKLASGVGASNAALDSFGNLYFGGNYNANLYKVPYNAATGQYVGWTTAPTTNCLGGNQDTSPCVFAPAVSAYLNTLGGQGYAGVVFDAQGNLFFETNTLPTTNPNAIFECNVACISSSSATPTLIYADSKPIGALAIDPWGNLFFIDGANGNGKASYLNEIPLSSGSYASTPTVVETYNSTTGNNGLSGLAIDGTGTVFFTTNNDGIFALPNTQSGGPNASGAHMVATMGAANPGGKGVALDSHGNLYGIPYISADTVVFIPAGSVSLGASPTGTAATAVSATIFDSAASCTTPPTLALSVTEFGVTTSEFTAAAGTTCSTAFSGTNGVFSSGPLTAAAGSSFSVTANFKPTTVGERNAALTITDSANTASGTAVLTGVGQGALANLDPGVWTAYTSGFTKPYSVSVDAAGDLAVADEGGSVFWIPAGSPAGTKPTSIGTGFSEPSATAFDANGNLYIADFGDNDIVEIPNVAGALVPASESTVVPDTVIFEGTALSKPSGLGFGPDGTLYISDLGNSRVVSWNPNTGQAAVQITGLKDPWGVAVDSSNNIYVADTGNGNVLVDSAGLQTTITPAGVTEPWGVAVDPSGSLVVSDKATGDIVWVPYDSAGTPPSLTVAGTLPIEKNPDSALGIALDSAGNLYTTDSAGAAVYAIQRTNAAFNFGTVQDGVSSNTATIYLEVTGNMPATLGTPAFTAPTSSDFTLTSTAPDAKCTSGSTGDPGQACQLQSVFTPPTGTAAGVISGTSTLTSNALNLASATISLTGTASLSSVLPQTITGFTPPASLFVGQQITLSATGGPSGNPVVFTIDPNSACPTCASITGTTLTASAVGSVIVDANQAAGSNGGNAYAAAAEVKATIAIASVTATGVPALIMSQVNWLSPLTGGGFTSGGNPAGGSFAVNQQGNAISGTQYGNSVLLINGQTGVATKLATISNPGGVTVDSKNNIYVAHDYSSVVLKVPYVNGAYVTLTDSTTAPACTGTDTTLCTFASVGPGAKAIGFDAAGNFYGVTVPGSTGASQIYECGTGCLPAGTGTVIYSEANGISQIAFDPWGNLFFTDGVYSSVSADESTSSNLYELPYTAGNGFAATPILLQTYTDATPAGYDNQLDGVAVTSNGTVYYATQNEGVFAVPNTQAGGPAPTHQYVVATQGAKGMTLDSLGNVWVAVYHSGGDAIGEILINDLTAPTAQLDGAATTAPFTVIDNAVGCGTAANFAFASSNAEFSATATGATCSTASANFTTPVSASNYTATVSFSATSGGPQTGTLTATDTANGGEGTATVSGTGAETPQTITFTSPVTLTDAYGVSPITLAATGGASGNPVTFTIDSSSTGTGTITGGNTLTVTGAGTLVIDANQVGGLVMGIYYSAATQAQLTITITQAAQTITFAAPATPVTFANGLTIPLSATSTSGETVVFTVDAASTGTGTISGSSLTVTGVGNLVIDANVASSTDYSAAAQVQQTIVVNQGAQAIVFAPPTTPVYYLTGLTISLAATGGGSGLPVTFTLDAKSTATATISATTVTGGISTAILTVTSQGALVIDANQASSANFTAAPQVQQIVIVSPAQPTQTINFPNPGTQVVGTPLTLTATATSLLPVSFSTTTTTVCTLSGTNNATATFIAAGSCTVTASQGGSSAFAAAALVSQTFTVNPTGTLPTISFAFSLSSLTVTPGTVGITQLTVNSVNSFAGTVSFACSNLPSDASCTFTPNPVTVAAGQSATTSLAVNVSSSTAAVHHDSRPLFPAATLAAALCFLGFRKRKHLQLLLLLVVGLVGLGLFSGCGGSGSTTKTATTQTTVTVTATSGNVQQTGTFNLLVN